MVGGSGAGKTYPAIPSGVIRLDQGPWSAVAACPLLELGAGFGGDFSGRENILLNGALLGPSRAQISERVSTMIIDVFRHRRVLRPAREVVSARDVRAAGFCYRGAPRGRRPADRRGACCGRRGVPAQVRGADRRAVAAGATLVPVSNDASPIEGLCQRTIGLDGGEAGVRRPDGAGRDAPSTTRLMGPEPESSHDASRGGARARSCGAGRGPRAGPRSTWTICTGPQVQPTDQDHPLTGCSSPALIQPDPRLVLGRPAPWRAVPRTVKRLLVRPVARGPRADHQPADRFDIELTASSPSSRIASRSWRRRAGQDTPGDQADGRPPAPLRAGPVDAVTVQALVFRDLFDRGLGKARLAAYVDPRIGKRIGEIDRLDPDRRVLLFHYSAYAPRLREMLELPNRKLLISHNVTPPVAVGLRADDRRAVRRRARAAAGLRRGGGSRGRRFVLQRRRAQGSRGGAHDGHSDPVRPTAAGAPATAEPTPPPTLLFVGRLAPHKRQDELIRLIAMLRRRSGPRRGSCSSAGR